MMSALATLGCLALPGEAPNVISEVFTQIFLTTLQVLWVAMPHIRALEVASEDLLKILPAVNDIFC
jgi:hypothetical protein